VADLHKDREIKMRKVNGRDTGPDGTPSPDILNGPADRGNRPSDPQFGAPSRTIDNTQRAKPTLTFP